MVVGIYLQLGFILSGDVSYLLLAAQQIASGGHYPFQIFETNPPMILYLYFPAIGLAAIAQCSLVVAVRVYIFLLATGSALLCYFFLKQLKTSTLFFMTVLFVLFILPLDSFGQREHLLIIFILPYLFLFNLRIENKKMPLLMQIIAGTMAGLGFSLKPFFLIPLVLIELFGMLHRRHFFAWFRVDCLIVMGILILYFLMIVFWEPNYLRVIWPLVYHYYFPFAKETWRHVFSPPYVMFCLAVASSYPIIYRAVRPAFFGTLLWLALVGFILSFLCVRTSWYYHVLPALSFAYLLMVWSLQHFFKGCHALFVFFVFLIVLFFPVYNGFLMLHYKRQLTHSAITQHIAEYIESQGGVRSIACIPIGTQDCFPLVNLTHSIYASRFPSLWWYSGLRKMIENPIVKHRVLRDQNYLMSSLANDLTINHPHWVIVNTAIFKDEDLIHYFLQNKNFRAAWAYYRPVSQIDSYDIYERMVRNST